MPLNVHGFMKAFKAFKGTAKKCENKNVSQFLLKYNFEMHGAGRINIEFSLFSQLLDLMIITLSLPLTLV